MIQDDLDFDPYPTASLQHRTSFWFFKAILSTSNIVLSVAEDLENTVLDVRLEVQQGRRKVVVLELVVIIHLAHGFGDGQESPSSAAVAAARSSDSLLPPP